MRVLIFLGVPLVLLCTAHGARATDAETASTTVFLRRATFDPLREQPTIAGTIEDTNGSTLRLVQLAGPPTASTAASLTAAMDPLLYVPDNTYLVRVRDPSKAASISIRWCGSFEAGYKLAEPLDALLTAESTSSIDLRVLLTSDADMATASNAIQSLGGTVTTSHAGLNGRSLRLTLPSSALGALLDREDADYAYASGTSMAAPAVSGAAALTRQWLATARNQTTPSAALIKALLLNGATSISPGQYGEGTHREIPPPGQTLFRGGGGWRSSGGRKRGKYWVERRAKRPDERRRAIIDGQHRPGPAVVRHAHLDRLPSVACHLKDPDQRPRSRSTGAGRVHS